MTPETPVERRLRVVVDDARMDAVMIDDDEIDAIDAGREAIALWRSFLAPMHASETGACRELVKSYARALLARCQDGA